MVNAGRELLDLPYFNDFGKFVPYILAQEIMKTNNFVTHMESNELYIYKDGIYVSNGEVELKKEVQKILQQYVQTNRVNETIEAIKRETYQPKEKFGNPHHLIAVKNGLLDINTKQLQPFTPQIIHLTKINANYNPEETPTKTIEFLKQVIHDDDIPTVQELFGYCLLKDYPIAKAFMMLGSGHNGKSTLLNLLRIFLGKENVATPSLQTLLENQFAAIELYEKLANIHADLSQKELINTGTFKMLTGKDMLRGEKKYQNAISFFNHAKLIYSANRLPKTKDRTTAFFRRWLVLDFPNEFPEDDPDTNPNVLDEITTEKELSGILNWSLEGLDRLLKQKHFTASKSRKQIEKQWLMETDSLRAFCDFALEKKENSLIHKKELWEIAYTNFCERNDIYVVKEASMTKDLPTILRYARQTRPQIGNERVRCWENLSFTPEFIAEFPIETKNTHIYTKTIGKDNTKENYSQKTLEELEKEIPVQPVQDESVQTIYKNKEIVKEFMRSNLDTLDTTNLEKLEKLKNWIRSQRIRGDLSFKDVRAKIVELKFDVAEKEITIQLLNDGDLVGVDFGGKSV